MHTRVFAAHPGGGNPCPVIPDADTLSDDQMLGLARRFGLDTVFILSSVRADVRLRYFLPDHEMGISGHATVAALTVQYWLGHLHPGSALVETSTGLFSATLSIAGPDPRVTLEQNKPTFSASASREAVAGVLGVDISVIAPGPVQSVSVSRPKLLVPLVSADVLNNLSPHFEQLWDLCDRLEVSGLYPFAHTSELRSGCVQARQYPVRAGFPEDAATGVAAGALGAYLAHYDLGFATGVHRFQIGQGYAMGHPSSIDTIVECAEHAVVRVAIEGSAQVVSREKIAV